MKKRHYLDDRPDYGTDELRARHITQIIPTENAGKVAIKIEDECLLDKLRLEGKLGSGDEATKRYDAGIWLRSLYDRAGLRQRTTMAYAIFGQAASGAEMSDAEAWNWKCWAETLNALYPPCRYVLIEACVFDRLKEGARHPWLTTSLDMLAKVRGL